MQRAKGSLRTGSSFLKGSGCVHNLLDFCILLEEIVARDSKYGQPSQHLDRSPRKAQQQTVFTVRKPRTLNPKQFWGFPCYNCSIMGTKTLF